MNNFEFYPTLDNVFYELAKIETEPYAFAYKDGDTEYPLTYEFENGEYIILDDRNVWNIKDYNLIFKTRLIIDNPRALFGKDGIAPINSQIKIALQWMSKASNRRDTKEVAYFSNEDNIVDKTISMSIKPDRLKNNVKFKIVFVLGNIIDISKDENNLANKKGLIIGTFNEAKIMLEGKGSEFPISRVSNGKNRALWVLEYSSTDPTIDKFTPENVCLVLNIDHKDYRLLDEDNLERSSALFKEVFSTALVMIFNHLDKEGYLEETKENENFEEGSICAAMHYFLRTFNININDLTSMMNSVKESVDRFM